MKLSFSTKGWHDQSWEDFFLIAAEQGFSGIELHDVRRFSASVSAPFSPQNAAATVRRMQDAGIGISCVDAGCNIAAEVCGENDIDYLIKEALLQEENGHPPLLQLPVFHSYRCALRPQYRLPPVPARRTCPVRDPYWLRSLLQPYLSKKTYSFSHFHFLMYIVAHPQMKIK